MPKLNVDEWTGIFAGRHSDITPLETLQSTDTWALADSLYEANSQRDPVEVADEWHRLSGLPLRVWPGRT